ncbi:hypothetical protein MPSI1_001881 [Malassezia psittaci]|uniref:3-phytase n=1 Tax=Malassezia psittaci TaxID=1821823 RepID=A0AAF0FA98_9BASI|nr:hypothetical protein MPSI1_001881 [Malassezia psittaci]
MNLIVALFPLLCAALVSASASKPALPSNYNNVTGTSSQAFPTDVGFEGNLAYSKPPLMAQTDKLNSTKSRGCFGVELRVEPLNYQKDNATSDDIYRNLGSASVYHSADDLFPETKGYAPLPDQCSLKQVHILHRHGARNPTSGDTSGAGLFGAAVWNASQARKLQASGPLEFLNHWNYSLGAEVLVHQGAQEVFDSGVHHYYQYAKLLEHLKHKPVLRTTSQSRMLDTARYWSLGFFGWDAASKIHLEVLTEQSGQNNSLSPDKSCTNSDNDDYAYGDLLSAEWEKVYTKKPAKRLQKYLKGIELNADLIYGMINLCAFETVVLGNSDFCPLFTKEDFENYEYDIDLQFMGNSGFMNPTGRAQGVGWVVEMLDRMNMTKYDGPISGQNTTLDYNSTYFPVDQKLYADFTHDSVITSVLTALNFKQIGEYLPATKPNPNRRYRASRVTPFAARFVLEVMDCRSDELKGHYLRAKINEAVVPLDKDQGCNPRRDGLCKLENFYQYQLKNAYKHSNYNKACFGKNGTDFSVYGPVRDGTI